MRYVTFGDIQIAAEVASTEAAREQGLSGRDSLAPGSGMLFVFSHDDAAGVWMKDMKFPIDIIWLDAGGRVVTLVPNVSPGSYPHVFYPDTPARYILELPAGFVGTHGVAKGDTFVLQ